MHPLILPFVFFFFNDTATTEIYTLSLHDALPIFSSSSRARSSSSSVRGAATALPVQFEISAVRRLFASPRGRKSLIVADVMAGFSRILADHGRRYWRID